MEFWGAAFGLFRKLVCRVPWEEVPKREGVQEGRTLLKRKILKAQQQTAPKSQTGRLAKQEVLSGTQEKNALQKKRPMPYKRKGKEYGRTIRML